jgi:hypothetical protein
LTCGYPRPATTSKWAVAGDNYDHFDKSSGSKTGRSSPPKCVRSSDYATGPFKNNNDTLLFVMLSVDDGEQKEKAITGFRSWFISQDKTKATVKNTVNCVKRFSYVLNTGDASPLLTLSHRNKHHAMSALATMPNILAGLQPLSL